jgi:arylsulfatase A-like enzyme
MLDDTRLGASSAFGGPYTTPTFERLAAPGLRFNRFHTTAVCSPTRQALLTGRNHHSVGMGGITEIATTAPGYNSILPNTASPLAQTLKLNGYSTAQFGKCHEVGPGDRVGGPSGPSAARAVGSRHRSDLRLLALPDPAWRSGRPRSGCCFLCHPVPGHPCAVTDGTRRYRGESGRREARDLSAARRQLRWPWLEGSMGTQEPNKRSSSVSWRADRKAGQACFAQRRGRLGAAVGSVLSLVSGDPRRKDNVTRPAARRAKANEHPV